MRNSPARAGPKLFRTSGLIPRRHNQPSPYMLTRNFHQDRASRDDLLGMLARVGAHPDRFVWSRSFCCPRCSEHRKKKSEKCLSVKSDADGFAFRCHHCDWKGGSGRTRHSGSAASPPPSSRITDEDAVKLNLARYLFSLGRPVNQSPAAMKCGPRL